jgi:hypothetical protein
MSGHRWEDDELLELLRTALAEHERVPDRFVEAGKAVFTWHSIDAELATLAYDSVTDPFAVAGGTRAEHAEIRELTFAFRNGTVQVQITNGGLLGQVVPPRRGEIELHVKGQALRRAEIDDQGWFSVTPRPRTPFRLAWRVGEENTSITDWLDL